jgi:hypothetical protein
LRVRRSLTYLYDRVHNQHDHSRFALVQKVLRVVPLVRRPQERQENIQKANVNFQSVDTLSYLVGHLHNKNNSLQDQQTES